MDTIRNPLGGNVNIIGPGSVVSGAVIAGSPSGPVGPDDGRRWQVWVDGEAVSAPLRAADVAERFVHEVCCSTWHASVQVKPCGGERR